MSCLFVTFLCFFPSGSNKKIRRPRIDFRSTAFLASPSQKSSIELLETRYRDHFLGSRRVSGCLRDSEVRADQNFTTKTGLSPRSWLFPSRIPPAFRAVRVVRVDVNLKVFIRGCQTVHAKLFLFEMAKVMDFHGQEQLTFSTSLVP